MQLALLIWLLAISAVISAALGLYAWKRRAMPGALPFAILAALTVIWTVANAFEMAGTTLAVKLFWANLQYLCYTTIPLCYLVLTLQFTGRERWLNRRYLVLLSIIPFITNIFIWINPNGLTRRNVALDISGPFSVISKTYGPWTYVHFAYSYLLFLISIALLVKTLFFTRPAYRDQLFVLLIGLLLPLVSNLLYISGLSPIHSHDMSPAVMGLSGILITWGLFRYRLFDILPFAHETVLMSIEDGVVVLDVQKKISAINPSAQAILGWCSQDIGKDVLNLLHPWPRLIQAVQNYGQSHQEVVFGTGGGTQYYDFTLTPVLDQFHRPVGHLMIFHDITGRKQVEEELRILSNTDALTHLPNRRKLFEDLHEEIERAHRYGTPFSLLMVDVNGMKQINDKLGHLVGDEALLKVAQVLCRLRLTDRNGRYGGDEFVVLLPSTSISKAEHAAERLLEDIRGIKIGEGLQLSVSIGIAELRPEDDPQGKSLLSRADAAMYGAKGDKQGRGDKDQ